MNEIEPSSDPQVPVFLWAFDEASKAPEDPLVAWLNGIFDRAPALSRVRTLLRTLPVGSALRVTAGARGAKVNEPLTDLDEELLGITLDGFVWISRRVTGLRGEARVVRTELSSVRGEALVRRAVTRAHVRDGLGRLEEKLDRLREDRTVVLDAYLHGAVDLVFPSFDPGELVEAEADA